jgi:hypothetical protein
MLKISDYLYVDKKHVIRQIIDDLLKSIDVYLEIKYLDKTEDTYLYVEEDTTRNEQLILVQGYEDSHGKWGEMSRNIISEKESDIEKYYTAYNLMKLYL